HGVVPGRAGPGRNPLLKGFPTSPAVGGEDLGAVKTGAATTAWGWTSIHWPPWTLPRQEFPKNGYGRTPANAPYWMAADRSLFPEMVGSVRLATSGPWRSHGDRCVVPHAGAINVVAGGIHLPNRHDAFDRRRRSDGRQGRGGIRSGPRTAGQEVTRPRC